MTAVAFAIALTPACGSSGSGGSGDAGEEDAGLDAPSTEAGDDATTDSPIADATMDSTVPPADAQLDTAPDVSLDSPTEVDAGREAGTDASLDSGSAPEAGTDSSAETGVDSGSPLDSGASAESGVDSGNDAAVDSGPTSCTVSSQCTGGLVCIAGSCGSTVLLLAGSSTNLVAGTFQPASGWITSMLSDATDLGMSLTIDSSGRGVGVYTSATGGVVSATVWNSGAWGAPAAITASAVARSQPSVDATGGTTSHAVYQDPSYQYWYLAYSGTWSTPQPIGVTGTQYYGPFAATVAARGANATASFFDGLPGANVNNAAAADLTGGSWQAKVDIVGNTIGGSNTFTIPTAIVPLSAGPELLLVYVDSGNTINFVSRSAGQWSQAAAITGATTNDPVGLAPLPGGGAILAFRGQDTNFYWSIYTTGAWSAVAPLSTPNVSIARPPAVTHGISGDVAEAAFIESDGNAYHVRLTGSSWSAPVLVGGASLGGVAIAAAP